MMNVYPIVQHNDAETEAFIEAVQAGIADADAGHTVPYSTVRKWLLSWGTEDKKPAPRYK